MTNDLVHCIALTLIPGIGPVQAKILLQHYEPEEIFRAKSSSLEKIEGIGTIRANAIKSFSDFRVAESEILFIESTGIRVLFLTDKDYPKRLLNCYDSPTLLYCKGEMDLNVSRVIAVIGTRNNSAYGKQVTEKLIRDLSQHRILVISGLAFGIDAIAHKAALKNEIPTVAVLAHGLNQVYPTEHSPLAKDMIKHGGGLLSEFNSLSKPDKHNFPVRNRIVAGMSDAVIVIETGIKGGSMITAELANGYNKDVFAVPGKLTDPKSIGCNELIRNNKAILLTQAEDLIQMLNWEEKKSSPKKQRELFIELTADEKIVVDILREKELVHIDELNFKSSLSSSAVAAAILNLELQGVLSSAPGKMYRLN